MRYSSIVRRCLAAAAMVGLAPFGAAPLFSQLTLRDALLAADHGAYANRIAAGTSRTQRAQTLAPFKGILPSVRFEAGYVRTTDPIGVFGSTLRQRTVTQASFDPHQLNYPSAVGNYQGGVVLEQPLLNADAWAGRSAATHAADASRAAEEWTRLSTHVDVVRAYYGTILAAERVATIQAADRAAHAHVAQAESMVRQGLVTKSDALLASVRAGDVEVHLAEAEAGLTTARRRLAVLLGGDTAPHPTEIPARATLPSTVRILAEIESDTASVHSQPRADVSAASDGLAAARADAVRARTTLLPRLNGFARYDWNSAARLYDGDRNWTVGIMASWSVFNSASELSDLQATAGRTAVARAQFEAASANAQLEVDETRTALAVALARLTVAERAVAQSAEAHRIVGRKYAGGLATVVELLEAQAVETQSGLALSQARWGAIVADAERRRALGLDPATLAALEEDRAVAVRDSAGGR